MSLRLRLREKRARDAERPFWQRGVYLPLLITVVLVLGAAALFLVFSDDPRASSDPGAPPAATQEPTTEPDGDPRSADDDATSAPPDGDEPSVPAEAGACVTPPGTGDDALSVAPEVQWSPVGNAPTASSADHGPTIQDGPKRCYAPTAAGALLAVHNFSADSNAGLVPLREVVDLRVLPSASMYDRLVREAADGGAGGSGVVVTPVAYRFVNAEPGVRYTVSVVYQVPGEGSTALIEVRDTVEWVGDDWMIADGEDRRQLSEVPGGYVEWGPIVDAPE